MGAQASAEQDGGPVKVSMDQPSADMDRPPLNTLEYHNQVTAAAKYLRGAVGSAEVAVVLGSGLGGFTAQLQQSKSCSYDDIPFMPQSTVVGHAGQCVVGELIGKSGQPMKVMCFSGRVHGYEGWASYELNFMARCARQAGVKLFILTNSAGGCLPGMEPGSIVMMRDYIRMTMVDPLQDVCDDFRFGPRGMSHAGIFSERLAGIARQSAKDLGIPLHEGIYVQTPGPTYETPTEVQAGIKMGAASFGMSTVPEAMASRAAGMETFAMSLCTNLACGLGEGELEHKEVVEVGKKAGPRFQKLLSEILRRVSAAGVQDLPHADQPQKLFPPAPKHLLPLARDTPWRPTIQHVLADALCIRENNAGCPSLSVAVLLPEVAPGQRLVDSMQDIRVLCMRQLPALGVFGSTASALNGQMVLGTIGDKRVCLLLKHAGEGYSNSEGSHLAQVLSAVGCTTVLAGLTGELVCWQQSLLMLHESKSQLDQLDSASTAASTTTTAADAASEAAASNATDGSTGGPKIGANTFSVADVTSRVKGIVPPPCAAEVAQGPHRGYVDGTRALFGTPVKTITYASFPGPSPPTAAEKQTCVMPPMAPECVVGVTNTAILETARALGLTVVACASSSAGDTVAWEVEEMLSVFVKLTLTPSNPRIEALQALVSDAAAGINFVNPWKFNTVRPAQESWQKVAEAAASVRRAFPAGLTVTTAVIIEGVEAKQLVEQMDSDVQISASSVPGWDAVDGYTPDSWSILVGTLDRTPLLVIHNNGDNTVSGVPSLGGLGFAVRMLPALGIKRMVVSAPVVACDRALPVSEAVLLRDHINLTGSNPLSGLNESKWGARFPDMSHPYKRQLRAAAVVAQPGIREVVLAHINSTSLDSSADGGFAQALGAQVLSSSCLVPLVIRARHMGVDVLGLGFVRNRVQDGGLARGTVPLAADAGISAMLLAVARVP